MEFKNHDHHLQTLARKTWDLHVRINVEISGLKFSHRRCVGVECCSLEKMTGIRDSLKDVHAALIFLQRIQSNENRKRDEAFGHLEETRKALIDRINEFPAENEVVEELIITFGKIEFPRSMSVVKNGISCFVVNAIRFGLEFVVMFATVYAGVRLCEGRQNKKKNVRLEKEVFEIAPMDSSVPLDVLCGRG